MTLYIHHLSKRKCKANLNLYLIFFINIKYMSNTGLCHTFSYGFCFSCGCKKESDKAKEPCKNRGHSVQPNEVSYYCSRCYCKKTDKNEPCPGIKNSKDPFI